MVLGVGRTALGGAAARSRPRPLAASSSATPPVARPALAPFAPAGRRSPRCRPRAASSSSAQGLGRGFRLVAHAPPRARSRSSAERRPPATCASCTCQCTRCSRARFLLGLELGEQRPRSPPGSPSSRPRARSPCDQVGVDFGQSLLGGGRTAPGHAPELRLRLRPLAGQVAREADRVLARGGTPAAPPLGPVRRRRSRRRAARSRSASRPTWCLQRAFRVRNRLLAPARHVLDQRRPARPGGGADRKGYRRADQEDRAARPAEHAPRPRRAPRTRPAPRGPTPRPDPRPEAAPRAADRLPRRLAQGRAAGVPARPAAARRARPESPVTAARVAHQHRVHPVAEQIARPARRPPGRC